MVLACFFSLSLTHKHTHTHTHTKLPYIAGFYFFGTDPWLHLGITGIDFFMVGFDVIKILPG